MEPPWYAALHAAAGPDGRGGIGPGWAYAETGLRSFDEDTGGQEELAGASAWLP